MVKVRVNQCLSLFSEMVLSKQFMDRAGILHGTKTKTKCQIYRPVSRLKKNTYLPSL